MTIRPACARYGVFGFLAVCGSSLRIGDGPEGICVVCLGTGMVYSGGLDIEEYKDDFKTQRFIKNGTHIVETFGK